MPYHLLNSLVILCSLCMIIPPVMWAVLLPDLVSSVESSVSHAKIVETSMIKPGDIT